MVNEKWPRTRHQLLKLFKIFEILPRLSKVATGGGL